MKVKPYETAHKAACMAAFRSNVPPFFTVEEIGFFDTFLDNIHNSMATTYYGEHIGKTHYYVIEDGGKIVACGGFGLKKEPVSATFAWGMVERSLHKNGYGEALLRYRIAEIKRLYPNLPILLDTTQHSYQFFERYGFVTSKITPDFYEKGMHRYDMVWEEAP